MCQNGAVDFEEPMDTLIAELTRLYLPTGAAAPAGRGAVELVTADGRTRAIVIPFVPAAGKRDGEDAQHWQRLCDVANILQTEFDFPAPAVSVRASGGYLLWLSLAAPVPVAEARHFLARLGDVHFPDVAPRIEALAGPVELPPALNPDNGKWSAFIHPGMGASFADESGLDMPPPAAGQLAFVEGLRSIPAVPAAAPIAAVPVQPTQPAQARPAAPAGLLLQDATLEDIVHWLHARGIEPTLRFMAPK
jgi:hypothetical protein